MLLRGGSIEALRGGMDGQVAVSVGLGRGGVERWRCVEG